MGGLQKKKRGSPLLLRGKKDWEGRKVVFLFEKEKRPKRTDDCPSAWGKAAHILLGRRKCNPRGKALSSRKRRKNEKNFVLLSTSKKRERRTCEEGEKKEAELAHDVTAREEGTLSEPAARPEGGIANFL